MEQYCIQYTFCALSSTTRTVATLRNSPTVLQTRQNMPARYYFIGIGQKESRELLLAIQQHLDPNLPEVNKPYTVKDGEDAWTVTYTNFLTADIKFQNYHYSHDGPAGTYNCMDCWQRTGHHQKENDVNETKALYPHDASHGWSKHPLLYDDDHFIRCGTKTLGFAGKKTHNVYNLPVSKRIPRRRCPYDVCHYFINMANDCWIPYLTSVYKFLKCKDLAPVIHTALSIIRPWTGYDSTVSRHILLEYEKYIHVFNDYIFYNVIIIA